MIFYKSKNLSLLSFLFIPILSFWNPSWLSLMGVQPYWPLFWLLPWSLIYGPLNGALTGLILGIILDSLINDFYTQIPGLLICGFWFGKIGKLKKNFLNQFQYGLISFIGCFLCGLLYFVQILSRNYSPSNLSWLFSLGVKNILTQVFLTGLIAPILCVCLFLLFSKESNNIAPRN